MTTSLVAAGLLSLLAGLKATEEPGDAPGDSATPVAVPQDEAAAEDEGPKYPYWTGNVDIGIIQKQGNTESLNGNANAKFSREAEPSRTTYSGWWIFEEDSGDITERKYGVRGKYDWFLSKKRKNYLYGIGLLSTDLSANVDLRYYAGAGVGWVWKDVEDLRFSTDFGLAYLNEEFRDGSEDDSGNYQLIYDFFWKPAAKWGLDSDFVGLMSMSDGDDVIVTWINELRYNFSESLTGGLLYRLDWDNTPAVGSKRDDNIIALTVGWTLNP